MNNEDYRINMLMRTLPDKKFKTALENYNNYIRCSDPEKRKNFRKIWIDYVKNNLDF